MSILVWAMPEARTHRFCNWCGSPMELAHRTDRFDPENGQRIKHYDLRCASLGRDTKNHDLRRYVAYEKVNT